MFGCVGLEVCWLVGVVFVGGCVNVWVYRLNLETELCETIGTRQRPHYK